MTGDPAFRAWALLRGFNVPNGPHDEYTARKIMQYYTAFRMGLPPECKLIKGMMG